MAFWNDDYDRTFDLNRDGKLDPAERFMKMEFETSSLDEYDSDADSFEDEYDSDADSFEDEQEKNLSDAGLDQTDLECMDEEERQEALEDAGLDPGDFDF